MPPTLTSAARRTRRSLAIAAAGSLAATGLLTAVPDTATAAPPDSYTVAGFDTSHHNHGSGETEPVDFQAAADSGQKFVFMKATQGTGFTDDWFARDYKGATDAGLLRAPYHFYDTGSGADQAAHFADTAKEAGYTGRNASELPPVLDFEPVQGECPAGVDAGQVSSALKAVEESLAKPIVYTSANFVDQCLGGDGSVFKGHTLWQPRYQSGEKEPADIPGAGDSWSFWQHTESGTVDGVPSEAVDRNVFRGSEAELRGMANLSASAAGSTGTATKAAAADGITRQQMLDRAATWLTANDGAQVPYSQSDFWGKEGYRQDCSGYVSMALQLGAPGPNTVGLAENRDLTTPIGIDDLEPGDLLIDAEGGNTTRHVVIFEKWNNADHTSYTAYEQRGGHGTDHRTLDYGLETGSEFKPYRPVKLTD